MKNLIVIIACFSVIACRKNNCEKLCEEFKLYKVDHFDSTGVQRNTDVYEYTGTSVSRFNSGFGNWQILEYNADNRVAVSKNYLAGMQVPINTARYMYDNNGHLKKITHESLNGNGIVSLTSEYQLNWENGNLTGLEVNNYKDYSSGILLSYVRYTNIYDGDNIRKCVLNEKQFNPPPEGTREFSDSLLFEYDNQGNYFSRQNPNTLFNDNYVFYAGAALLNNNPSTEIYHQPMLWAFGLSRNNITAIINEGRSRREIELVFGTGRLYQTVSAIRMNKRTIAKFSYDCK